MTFNMTPQQFGELQVKAGIPEEQSSGMVDQYGVQAHWCYENGALTCTILKKPMFVPESVIASRFRKWAGLP
jgi:hypothetical protein